MSNLASMAHESYEHAKHTYADMSRRGVALFSLVIVTLIVFLLLVWFKPEFVLRERHGRKCDEVDYFVALLGALIISLIILIILWLLAAAFW